MSDADRYILLRHERVHLRQRARMGDVAMAFVYLVPILPLGLAWGRARIEWEAYVETIRATAQVHGRPAAERLRPEIVRRFTSARLRVDVALPERHPSLVRRRPGGAAVGIGIGSRDPARFLKCLCPGIFRRAGPT